MTTPYPRVLGKYTISNVIGEGAMGVVYKAVDPVIKRTVAIKRLRRDLIESSANAASLLARFRNEAQAAGRLMHPGIVTVHDYGEDTQGPFIVMEYVEGYTLKQHLAMQRSFSNGHVLKLMNQLLDALHYAHEQGVWHRDIKPANLILTRHGALKITDFGIARIETLGLTRISSALGTPGHMAPEQYTGEQVDRRADIFASGVLLYQLLTLHAPFGGSDANVMFETLNSEPAPPSELMGVRGKKFDAIVAKAMAKRPDQRYATALAFQQALSTVGPPAAAPLSMALDLPIPPPISQASVGPPTSKLSQTSTHFNASHTRGWQSDFLQTVESELALVLGPIAPVLVRKFAKTAPDVDALRNELAAQIDDVYHRSTFLRRTQATLSGIDGQQHEKDALFQSFRPSHDVTLLGESLIDIATQTLAKYMGPIAKILVTRAAAEARSKDEFLVLLVAHLDDEEDRFNFLTVLTEP